MQKRIDLSRGVEQVSGPLILLPKVDQYGRFRSFGRTVGMSDKCLRRISLSALLRQRGYPPTDRSSRHW